VAVVVDRTANKLRLYLDGVEKATADKPASFDVFSGGENGNSSYDNRLFLNMNPQSFYDEIRLLNFARTAEQISNTWFGSESGFAMKKAAPQNPTNGKESPPEKSPTNPGSRDILGDLTPKETRIKRDAQREERR
jgi:hypothetical protein